ncbi:MAG: hypothetical protein NW200_05225 [Hyphomonadaceae bacterium]|nr:hypothetical protein [Hyphomonadaceae bacterium]
MESDPPDLPPGWRAATADEAAGLARALRREMAPQHILHGRAFTVIARRDDADDVLLRLDDGEVAEMHLSWASQSTADFPGVILYLDFAHWQEAQF